MAKVQEKLKATELRRQGLSINEICRKLQVSKSVVSLWCRDISLNDEQRERLKKRMISSGSKGRQIGADMNRRKKEERVLFHKDQGKNYVGSLSKRELTLVGTAIYWGEGSKKSQLAFINADPDMVIFMCNWFQIALGVSRGDFMPRIFINALHKERDLLLKKFWSNLLHLPVSQFRSTVFIQREHTKKYANHDEYYGMLSLRLRNSSEYKYKILGLIEGLKCSKLH